MERWPVEDALIYAHEALETLHNATKAGDPGAGSVEGFAAHDKEAIEAAIGKLDTIASLLTMALDDELEG